MNGQMKREESIGRRCGKLRKGKTKEKGSPIQRGCDYKFQGENRGREIEDIVRVTPSCDHFRCSTIKQKSRISLFTAQSNAVWSIDLHLERKTHPAITHHDCIFQLLLVCPACVSSNQRHFVIVLCQYLN